MKKWIKINIPFGPIYNYSDDMKDKDSFCKRKLNIPGTVVKVKDLKSVGKNGRKYYGKAQTYIIGDINCLKGVCDDCTAFDNDAIVESYRILDCDF